ncbi:MAG TPA: hypothetical protein VNF29_07100 [Candidatus Binataceae bacterium]|nr:hypothetical protein [Candidatus Binataceae bacterium]
MRLPTGADANEIRRIHLEPEPIEMLYYKSLVGSIPGISDRRRARSGKIDLTPVPFPRGKGDQARGNAYRAARVALAILHCVFMVAILAPAGEVRKAEQLTADIIAELRQAARETLNPATQPNTR